MLEGDEREKAVPEEALLSDNSDGEADDWEMWWPAKRSSRSSMGE